jgi:2,3-dimethylmalate lyase
MTDKTRLKALAASYGYLKQHGSTGGSPTPAYTMVQLHGLMGFPEVWAFERRFAEP